jgi:Protein of unknown function (DUF1697)
MPTYIALLRAVNVGGTGKLPMAELEAMCVAAGFAAVKTYIASGNVVFSTKLSAAKAKAALEKRLQEYAGKPVGVIIRTADEMAAVLKANPFPKAPPSFTVAIFLDDSPPADALKHVKGQRLARSSLPRQSFATSRVRPHDLSRTGRGEVQPVSRSSGRVAASKRLSWTASLSGASHSAGRPATLPVRSLAGRWPQPSPYHRGAD